MGHLKGGFGLLLVVELGLELLHLPLVLGPDRRLRRLHVPAFTITTTIIITVINWRSRRGGKGREPGAVVPSGASFPPDCRRALRASISSWYSRSRASFGSSFT